MKSYNYNPAIDDGDPYVTSVIWANKSNSSSFYWTGLFSILGCKIYLLL